MFKLNKLIQRLLILSVFASLFFVNRLELSADDGPTNYCIPSNDLVPLNAAWGYPESFWCYPLYIKSQSWGSNYLYYFTLPILQVQVVDATSGEIKIDRNSRGNGGQGMQEWEGCYIYTGVRGELEPGAKYRIKYWANYNYYGYGTTDYCNYGWSTYRVHRVFIDFNLDGDFHDADEWINDPARIAAGKTIKIGSTKDWRFYSSCLNNYLQEFEITIPDDQKNGVSRMRVMTSYYYPYTNSVGNYTIGQARNACWNGYVYDYSYYYGPGMIYGYNYGEMEDYLIEWTVPIKDMFPNNKAPFDILLAGEKYDGTTRMLSGIPTEFPRPFVRFGGPQSAGTMLTYKIVGPLPSLTTIYEATYNGGTEIPVGDAGMLDVNFRYDIQTAKGPASVNNTYVFKNNNGGEYQVVIGLKKPTQPDYKIIKKNFTVSWEWDMAATNITFPLPNGEPRYHKYPRNLNMDLRGEIQNVGLRAVAKFDVYYRVYNSKGELMAERKRAWDTVNFGDYLVAPKAKVALDFGTFKTNVPDEYKSVITVELKSAGDFEPYNDQFRRKDQDPYTFEVRDEIQAQAYAINVPKQGSEIIAGRPFIASVDLRNQGVGDITNCPTTITVTEEPSGKLVFTRTITVQDIPSGRYNLKSVQFDPEIITKPGTYRLTLRVSHPDDQVLDDNEIYVIFTVTGGLSGTYTIGTKNAGSSRNYTTVAAATDELFLRGLSGSVVYEFTDDVYEVNSMDGYSPAWDLSTAIMGLGYNAETGTYNTITYKPSIDKSVTKGSVKINLNSTNGQGVFMGQSTISSNTNSVQADNFGRGLSFIKFSNNGGYITFDGGANSSLKFVLNSERDAFGAVFYLNAGSRNITVKNIIMENGNSNTACRVSLPNVIFSVVDGFTFTDDEYLTETGPQGYSAGIVNRGKVLALKNEAFVLSLDTLTNTNNKFNNNEISGFGYGIVSYGIGPLRVPELQDYRPFYNENTEIMGNKIYNVTAAGIVLGHEQNSKVLNNTIFDVNGNCGEIASGIIAGGNSAQGVSGYNNMNLVIDANKISNVRGNTASYGILVDQDANKYPVGSKYAIFPDRADDLRISNNAIFDIKAKNSNSLRAGIHALTERNKEISDPLVRLITPRYTDIFIQQLSIANNTVILGDDGVVNNGNIAGIGIQQASVASLINNAISITDGNISSLNEVSAGIFYQGSNPSEAKGLLADRNAYWVSNANAAAYRHIYTDFKSKIIELGNRNEYQSLEQWQMASGSELNSVSNGNFSNDYYTMGNYPAELKVKSTVKGSVLSKRGDRISSYETDLYGTIRGQAGSRYDLGAIEFNGSLYNRDAEMLVITSPGSYRSTIGTFSDAEYVMTEAPVAVTAMVRNSGNLQVTDKKFTVNIYRESPLGSWIKELGPVDIKTDIEATENALIDFQLADGTGTEFVPKSYNDLRNENYQIPSQFIGMEPNVTPRYRIEILTESDEYNNNNMTSKELRFYLRRSSVKVLVSSQNNVDLTTATSSDDLASGLNKAALDKGMNQIGWEINLVNGRYDYDVFQRAGWEPRNVNYSNYRSMFWSDGDDKSLSRLQKLNIEDFLTMGSVSEKKNLIVLSQEMVRENTNVDDADEVFVRDILRADFRFPGNPLGGGISYAGKSVTGVALGRDLQFDIVSTGVAGDADPMPGLMNIVSSGDGISKMAIRYNSVQNNEWPDPARIGGVGTSSLSTNVLYVGIDWRHFGDIETLLRGTFDFAEGNGGIVVPVELMNFEATAIAKRVELNWRTASEQGSTRFDIERADVNSTGRGNFVKIDEAAAAGNSNVIMNYGPVVDNNVSYGKTYSYRLKMVDRDGKYEYSDVKTVTLGGIEGKAWLGSVSPNPVNGISSIEYGLGNGMNVNIAIYDANGKKVIDLENGYRNTGVYNLQINSEKLSSGAYTIIMNIGETVLTESMTVVK